MILLCLWTFVSSDVSFTRRLSAGQTRIIASLDNSENPLVQTIFVSFFFSSAATKLVQEKRKKRNTKLAGVATIYRTLLSLYLSEPIVYLKQQTFQFLFFQCPCRVLCPHAPVWFDHKNSTTSTGMCSDARDWPVDLITEKSVIS